MIWQGAKGEREKIVMKGWAEAKEASGKDAMAYEIQRIVGRLWNCRVEQGQWRAFRNKVAGFHEHKHRLLYEGCRGLPKHSAGS